MENSRNIHPPVQNHHHSGPHLGLETIQRQASHNSPYHVHPYPAPVPVQQAFQSQEANMFHPKGLRPHQDTREGPVLGRALCLTSKDSPVPGRVSHLNEKFQDSVTMFSDTDELVARISSMFPTVSHTHIRILLKKLHMGVAESLAAMHPPIAYPGSSDSGRFSPRQDMMQAALAYYRSARPRHPEQQTTTRHSSPKMKLKYLKSVFPKADETFILEVLAKNDNSVQMAGQDLEAMGYVKKDNMQQKKKEPTPQPVKKVVLMRTLEDRQLVFEKLHRKYWSVPEKLVMIALESVEYNEERADNILSMILQEYTSPMIRPEAESRARVEELPGGPIANINVQPEVNNYQSMYSNVAAGPNPAMRQGPQDELLLEDYMPWNGPNPELRMGQAARPAGALHQQGNQLPLARGPSGIARGPSGLAQGPSGVAQGPSGLAQGSMYRNRN
ncbi:uncharacterized protein LOC115447442 isoform X3 [Manduca sexta]|uniref:CUE domain-containing protein n=1 Tax=Manduca sexta TaxID=7130 RepID=A0A921ZGC9_MANSE|nr:uncharacterized protein LOC115447442 isoform X3 [Manduca sexta]KAG6456332.1 hypothetical protein O3G_MSEX009672 [Manduca sexta]